MLYLLDFCTSFLKPRENMRPLFVRDSILVVVKLSVNLLFEKVIFDEESIFNITKSVFSANFRI